VFEQVVTESSDAPKQPLAEARTPLYLVHLAVLLWWLLDKSPNQRDRCVGLMTQQLLPSRGWRFVFTGSQVRNLVDSWYVRLFGNQSA
jgi:hypothetical protein